MTDIIEATVVDVDLDLEAEDGERCQWERCLSVALWIEEASCGCEIFLCQGHLEQSEGQQWRQAIGESRIMCGKCSALPIHVTAVRPIGRR